MAQIEHFKDDESRLQDFLDGRLDDSQRAALLGGLAARPSASRRVVQLMANDAALKRSAARMLDEAVPEQLLAAIREPRVVPLRPRRGPLMRRTMDIAALAAVLVLGLFVGWFAHNRLIPLQDFTQAAYSNALTAFAFHLEDPEYPIEFTRDRMDDLVPYTVAAVGQPISPPDLGARGFDLVGGRLLPVASGRAVMYLYRNRDDTRDRISIYVWRPNGTDNGSALADSRYDIVSRTWMRNGIGFTLLALPGQGDIDALATEVRSQFKLAQAS